ncbi:MAG: hypothetical protein R3E32_03460 [Chitinophagales bacterium]
MNKNQLFISLISLLIVSLSSCLPHETKNTKLIIHKAEDFNISYDLVDADRKYRLPGKLVEISGLCIINDTTIACVQDEMGELYTFNLNKSLITSRTPFGKEGDYEGVACTDSLLYVLRSSGKIYEIQHFKQDSQSTVKYRTDLRKFNNAQGMVYDRSNNRLLVACNGLIGDEASIDKVRSIYSFDLQQKKMDSIPIISFTIDDIYKFLEVGGVEKTSEQLAEFFSPGSTDLLAFQTSGLAIHPITGDYYLVSSKDNFFMILSNEGQFRYIRQLDSSIFRKPEGITFLPNGDLFISNEGVSEIANITRFNYVKDIE